MRARIPVLVCLLVLSALPAAADVDIDVRGGVYFDETDPFLGAGILTEIGDSKKWFFNPNVEVVFGDVDILSLNADAHYDLESSGTWTFWLGGGLGILSIDGPDGDVPPDVDDDDTEIGLNLLAGIGQTKGEVRWFGQLKAVIADESQLVAAVGLRF